MYSAIKKKKNSRRKHRNSHLGCGTCKKRRIKCDETLPQCLNCVRGKLQCAYLKLDESQRHALRVAQQNHSQQLEKQKLNEASDSVSQELVSSSPLLPTSVLQDLQQQQQQQQQQPNPVAISQPPIPKFKLEDGGIINGNYLLQLPKLTGNIAGAPPPLPPSGPGALLPTRTGLMPVVGLAPQAGGETRRPSLKSPSQGISPVPAIKNEPGTGTPTLMETAASKNGPPNASTSTYTHSAHPPNIPIVAKEGSSTPSPSNFSMPQLCLYTQPIYALIPTVIYPQQNGHTGVTIPQTVQLPPMPQHHLPTLPRPTSIVASEAASGSSTTTGTVLAISSPHQPIALSQHLLLPNLPLPHQRYPGGVPPGSTVLPSMAQHQQGVLPYSSLGSFVAPTEFTTANGSTVSAIDHSQYAQLMAANEAKLSSHQSPISIPQPSVYTAYTPTPIYFSQPLSIVTGSGTGGSIPPVSATSNATSRESTPSGLANIVLPPLQLHVGTDSYRVHNVLLPPVKVATKEKIPRISQMISK